MDNIKSFDKFNEEKGEKWIQDAIKKPGSLKKSLKKGKGEKLTKTEINDEIRKLRGKDKDKGKKGLQGLTKRDLLKYRRLSLAKTLKSMKESNEFDEITLTRDELQTFMDDVANNEHTGAGWSDTSYRICRFLGIDPTEGI